MTSPSVKFIQVTALSDVPGTKQPIFSGGTFNGVPMPNIYDADTGVTKPFPVLNPNGGTTPNDFSSSTKFVTPSNVLEHVESRNVVQDQQRTFTIAVSGGLVKGSLVSFRSNIGEDGDPYGVRVAFYDEDNNLIGSKDIPAGFISLHQISLTAFVPPEPPAPVTFWVPLTNCHEEIS